MNRDLVFILGILSSIAYVGFVVAGDMSSPNNQNNQVTSGGKHRSKQKRDKHKRSRTMKHK